MINYQRDNQRSKTYRSEAVINRSDHNHRFTTNDQCQEYANEILSSNYIFKIYEKHNKLHNLQAIRVIPNKSKRTSSNYSQSRKILLSQTPYHMSKLALLHEIAHQIHYDLTVSDQIRSYLKLTIKEMAEAEDIEYPEFHGREFNHIFIHLVKRFLGKEAKRALAAEFKKNKVKYTVSKALF